MTIGRLLLVCACLTVAWLEAVLAALLWPIGPMIPPIDGVDTWLAGFVTIGAGLLLFAMYRQVARPLIEACDALLRAARGLPSATAAPHFGRADEVGEIAVALATLQAERAQRHKLEAELAALQAERERKMGEMADLSRLIDDVLDAVPVPVSVCDPQGRIAFVNRAWEAFFGVARDAVLGLHAGDDGTDRQSEVELRGQRFHRLHALLGEDEGGAAAVVTTFVPAPAPSSADADAQGRLETIAQDAQRLLRGQLDGEARSHIENIAASASAAREPLLL